MAVAEKSNLARIQFDLLTLFEWMLLAGLFCVLIASGGRNYTVWYRFSQLPSDDVALRRWYDQQEQVPKFAIDREGQAIKFRAQRRSWLNADEPPEPPWATLGYRGLTSGGIEYSMAGFRLHALSLVIGVICILFMFALRRRFRRQRCPGGTSIAS